MPRPLQALRGAWTFVQLVRNTDQLDKVFELIQSVDVDEADALAHLTKFPRVQQFLREPWSMARPDLEQLRRLPEGTLGRVFAEHMIANGLDPDALFREHDGTPLAWVHAHLEQTHDVWHMLTGFSTELGGELGLQAFYLAQLEGPPPMAILSAGLLHTMLYRPQDIADSMDLIVEGWRKGRRCEPLFGRRWDRWWDRPLADLQTELGLPVSVPGQRAAA